MRETKCTLNRKRLAAFFLTAPTQLFHHDAGVVAVAAGSLRHGSVRIRALCNEIRRARAVGWYGMWEVILGFLVRTTLHKCMQHFANSGGNLALFQVFLPGPGQQFGHGMAQRR